MKQFILILSVVLFLCSGYAAAKFGPAKMYPSNTEKAANSTKKGGKQAHKGDAVKINENGAAGLKKAAARANAHAGLEEVMKKLEQDSKKETRQWLDEKLDNRVELAKTVQKQVTGELNMIRQMAVKEGAVKTVAAIDGLLEKRNARYEKMVGKMEKAKEKLRRRERIDKKADGRRGRRGSKSSDKKRMSREERRKERSDRKSKGKSKSKSKDSSQGMGGMY